MKTSAALVKLIVFMVITSMLTLVLAATIGNISLRRQDQLQGGLQRRHRAAARQRHPRRRRRRRHGRLGRARRRATSPLVEFSLTEGREIPESTIARLRYRNITGERYIALTQGEGSAQAARGGRDAPAGADPQRPRPHRPVQRLPPAVPGARPASRSTRPPSRSCRSCRARAAPSRAWSQKTASLTTTLADKDEVIGRVIDNLTAVLATVDDRSTELSDLIVQLRRLSAGFAEDREVIGASLDGHQRADRRHGRPAGRRPRAAAPGHHRAAHAGHARSTTTRRRSTACSPACPSKLDLIIGTATYASQFNFYLCGLAGEAADARRRTRAGSSSRCSGRSTSTQLVNSEADRCQGRGFSG